MSQRMTSSQDTATNRVRLSWSAASLGNSQSNMNTYGSTPDSSIQTFQRLTSRFNAGGPGVMPSGASGLRGHDNTEAAHGINGLSNVDWRSQHPSTPNSSSLSYIASPSIDAQGAVPPVFYPTYGDGVSVFSASDSRHDTGQTGNRTTRVPRTADERRASNTTGRAKTRAEQMERERDGLIQRYESFLEQLQNTQQHEELSMSGVREHEEYMTRSVVFQILELLDRLDNLQEPYDEYEEIMDMLDALLRSPS